MWTYNNSVCFAYLCVVLCVFSQQSLRFGGFIRAACMSEPALLREDQRVLRLLPSIFFMIQLLPSARMAECNVFWSWNDISMFATSILLDWMRSLLDIKLIFVLRTALDSRVASSTSHCTCTGYMYYGTTRFNTDE